MSLKCPYCGSTEKFVTNQWIEHHDVYVNGDGCWVDDFECYDSYHDTDGATCLCCACGHDGSWDDFSC